MPLNCVRYFFEDLLNPIDFYSSMRPFFCLNFLGGLWAFKVVGNIENPYLKMSYFGLINSLAHAVFFCVCHVLRINSRRSFIGHFFSTKISEIANDIQNISQSGAILVSLISCFLKRNKFRSLMRAITLIDNKFTCLGVTINYKSIIRMAFLLIGVKIISSGLLILAGYVLLRSAGIPDITVWVLFFMPHIINSNLKITFIFVLFQISNRFRYISHILNRIRLRRDQVHYLPIRGSMNEIRICKITGMTDFQWNSDKQKNHKLISNLCKIHEELCDASYLVEEYFSHQILTLIAIDFLVLMCCSYYIIDTIYNHRSLINVHFIGFLSFIIFYLSVSFITAYGLVRAADIVTHENEKCGIYIHKLLNAISEDDDEKSKKNLRRFSLQLLHRKIKFTACGLFNLDNTLIFTMVGATTTYLIMFFQFTSKDHNN